MNTLFGKFICSSNRIKNVFSCKNLSLSFSTTIGSHLDNGTIYALSTGFQKSGISVIRISGKNATRVISQMTSKSLDSIRPRYCYYTDLYHPQNKKLLDKSILIYYNAPHSFTGEDIVEIQCHGSIAVISSILSGLSTLNDFRPARAGEFTRRGFLNNKYDLTEVESLSDLLQAETEKQREQAILGYSGQLNQQCNTWKSQLIDYLSYMETIIDFSDNTDDLDELQYIQKGKDLQALWKEISTYTNNYGKSQLIRHGLTIPIYGAPNVGKSSLLNKLIKSEKAIVSPYKGTTRDIIEVNADLNGYKVIFQDTAGIHHTNDEIEQIGIQRAIKAVHNSELKIYIMDIHEYLQDSSIYKDSQSLIDSNTIVIMNKMDLLDPSMDLVSIKNTIQNTFKSKCKEVVFLSCKVDQDISVLEDTLSTIINDYYQLSDEDEKNMKSLLLNTRQQHDLVDCQNHIQHAIAIYNDNMVDAVAEELRLAIGCIGRIVGQVDIEHVLDNIFSTFCIGK